MLAPAEWIGAASDLGKRHPLNQDALALAVSHRPRSAIVAISDGVTSAERSELGSMLAARTACDVLRRDEDRDVSERYLEAFHEAHLAVLSGAPTAACTLVAAVVRDTDVFVANVGDSRAYWFGDDGTALLLTVDDSVAQLRILLGMGRAQAEASAHSHAITKWLGRQASDVTPDLRCYRAEGPGWLLVCSDGLWNYASEPERLGAVVSTQLRNADTPVQLAAALVAWANEQGGRDNITVAVVRLDWPGL